jgi:hypothetical protein
LQQVDLLDVLGRAIENNLFHLYEYFRDPRASVSPKRSVELSKSIGVLRYNRAMPHTPLNECLAVLRIFIDARDDEKVVVVQNEIDRYVSALQRAGLDCLAGLDQLERAVRPLIEDEEHSAILACIENWRLRLVKDDWSLV